MRGLSGLDKDDAEYIGDVICAAKATGVVVGLASCVQRIVISGDLRAGEMFGYRTESYKLHDLRLLSSRGTDPFPKPLPFQHKGITDVEEDCIVSDLIRRSPASRPYEVEIAQVGNPPCDFLPLVL